MPNRLVDIRFAQRMRELLAERGLSYRALAARTYYSRGYLHDLATGRKSPTPETARRLDGALGAQGELAGYADAAAVEDPGELARRVAASDLGAETLARLESAVDDLAVRYASDAPADLLPAVLEHLGYVRRLIEVRTTLTRRRRLVVAGGWLALLAATVHIDLRHRRHGAAHLTAAHDMAAHAEHPEIIAWCLETRAWDRLVTADFSGAVELSRQAQRIAPAGSSALIQATAQEGRALARLGQRAGVHDALARTAKLVQPLSTPDRPEHHYRYDPAKALAYTATTLAWSGDPAAEEYARVVVADMDAAAVPRPRRMASARLDLGLALVAANKPDEAASVALDAIGSGRVVASNWWRVAEVLAGVERFGIPEAADLREAAETLRPAAG
jgi:transcriptional regulator with XRE-family HTH domain